METIKQERSPVSVSAAVYISDKSGKLLLLQQSKGLHEGTWGPPAGGMNPHENPADTAKRETKEEIGVNVDLLDLIGIYIVDRGEISSGVGFAFRGKLSSQNILLENKGEISAYNYFSIKEVKGLINNNQIYKPEYTLPVMKDWIKGIAYPLKLLRPIFGITK